MFYFSLSLSLSLSHFLSLSLSHTLSLNLSPSLYSAHLAFHEQVLVLFLNPRAIGGSSSSRGRLGSLLRTALPPHIGERTRKGAPNKCFPFLSLLSLLWLTDPSSLWSNNAKEKSQESRFGSLERSNTAGLRASTIETRKKNSKRTPTILNRYYRTAKPSLPMKVP
ncbi:PIEZO1_2 [Acanthosepion pharaonis]|uniref:PIEZO1_2 n=1 Tax=Acanthosepion pharaonis TaxID=158019 RepID=A0A812DDG6_ACAPH|nr:PIEZO1_2 [Sepia pharaonis]